MRFLDYVDDKLQQLFRKKAHDPAKGRAKHLMWLQRTHDQFHATEPRRGRKSYSVKNNVVKLTTPFAVEGKTEHHIPFEQFPAALKSLRSEVETGKHDAAIAAAAASSGKTLGIGRSGASGKAWTPERRARYQKTIAAKRAGKPRK